MKIKLLYSFGIILLFVFSGTLLSCSSEVTDPPQDTLNVKIWMTDPARNIFFTEQRAITDTGRVNGETIVINKDQTYQVMDGFGYSLTGGSALHLFNMSAAARNQILKELFETTDKNIGVSYLRISIGASDLDTKVFSYNDLPTGQTDPDMLQFSLAEDRQYLIPVLKEILAINPEIKIMGSPWSAPVWMKNNNNSIAGSLLPQYYSSYAKYFVKYIQGMKDEGITIDAITIQNEPLHPGNNPSMYMLAADQAAFIKGSLGPAFQDAGINTKIIIYDHNADRIDYPLSILGDAAAKNYIDGSAFHLYGGQISSLSQVHNAHPDKNLYFTEQWTGVHGVFADELKWNIRELTVGATRNWCKTVLEWNLAADQNQEPHTPGGCTECLGAITIQGDQVTRNVAYYITAHASKFVRPGSKRIESNYSSDLPNVAFLTPAGNVVVIILNNSTATKTFNIKLEDKTVKTYLAPGAVGTFIW
jgi:glucosylceramidase